MARSAGVVVGVPPHGMGDGEPLKELADRGVRFGPHDEMPMIGHDRVVQNSEGYAKVRFVEHPLKRLVVGRLLKQCHPRHRPIEAVEDHPSGADSLGSRHGSEFTTTRKAKLDLTPFSLRMRFRW